MATRPTPCRSWIAAICRLYIFLESSYTPTLRDRWSSLAAVKPSLLVAWGLFPLAFLVLGFPLVFLPKPGAGGSLLGVIFLLSSATYSFSKAVRFCLFFLHRSRLLDSWHGLGQLETV